MGDGEARKRYILVYNPEEADRANRQQAVAKIGKELERIGELNCAPHTNACCKLLAHETYGRRVWVRRHTSETADGDDGDTEAIVFGCRNQGTPLVYWAYPLRASLQT